MQIINLGIVAHVDAGKTTLTEQFLWRLGAIRQPGRVDEGTAAADFMEIERRRGISIQAASIAVHWRDVKLNLIDTPGHVDFAFEVERALRVLDVAIMVISAAEGVQSHTRALWEALRALSIPTLIFLNKIDQRGADAAVALQSVRDELHAGCCPLELAVSPEGGARILNRATVLEALCENDDDLMVAYIEGEDDAIEDGELLKRLAAQMGEGALCPTLAGAALAGVGIEELLEALYILAPRACADASGPVAGLVYRVNHDENSARIAHVKLYSGTLRNRDAVRNTTRDVNEKIARTREIRGNRYTDTGLLTAGDIGAVYGLNSARVGDILGEEALVPGGHQMAVPLLRTSITPKDEGMMPALVSALGELTAENPTFAVALLGKEAEVNITGTIQLEVLETLLRERFGLEVIFSPPRVIYRETPAAIAEGFEAYTMPKPCWAVIRFLIEPLPPGSGVEYVCAISNEKIHYRYQGQIEQTIPTALEQGPLGWQVTDLRITLTDGGDHPIHTHPLDFALATPLAMIDGLVRAGTVLLEPMLRVRVTAPDVFAGRITGDFSRMRGQFDAPVAREGRITLEGRVPVATSLDYPVRLASLSGGEALLSTRFDGYAPCPLELGATAPHRGVDPRERAKYILWKRSALQA